MIGVLDDEETQRYVKLGSPTLTVCYLSHEIVHLDRDNPQLKSQFNGYVSISKGSKLTKERQNWEEISPPVNRGLIKVNKISFFFSMQAVFER